MAMLQCTKCSSIFEPFPPKSKCEKCGGILEYVYELKSFKFEGEFGFWRYRSLLPEVKNIISLGEGGTPLHKAQRLAREVGLEALNLKDETRNPTSSFRDRCAALMVSNAVDLNYDVIVCASNGNLGASLAAYCAKIGLSCQVIVPELMDMGKLAQMIIYDAIIEEHGRTVDESIKRAESLAAEMGWYQATAELNPLTIEAQKTIAYEVVEQLGTPEWFIVPMGSGGTIYSIWKGFKEMLSFGMIDSLPKMVGVQPQGCAPIVKAYLEKKFKPVTVLKPFTRALGVLVGSPLYGRLALKAINISGGTAVSVEDNEILEAEQNIAKFEGIFAEPSSSATIAALKKLVKEGIIDRKEKVVCLITGSGLKTTDVLQALTKRRKTALLGFDLSTKEKILRILSQGDTYGYDLWKKLGKIMTRTAIYQHLSNLHEKGLVTSYEKGGRKYVKITRRGRRFLKAVDELKTFL